MVGCDRKIFEYLKRLSQMKANNPILTSRYSLIANEERKIL